ncbi:hypothetical protein C468_04926 [Halorubrum kocurii JCM 14978]|uniref:Uncharacterized protein n=1 Tax=Halorubrum kocurii JCM 14978 TaxID=1230456 RepID=M0P8G9_9EURY|nr:hypothetical protein C468_04926 [Halorubrum kocurii JCM 14978]
MLFDQPEEGGTIPSTSEIPHYVLFENILSRLRMINTEWVSKIVFRSVEMKRLVSNTLWAGLETYRRCLSTDLCANYSRFLKHIYRPVFCDSENTDI